MIALKTFQPIIKVIEVSYFFQGKIYRYQLASYHAILHWSSQGEYGCSGLLKHHSPLLNYPVQTF